MRLCNIIDSEIGAGTKIAKFCEIYGANIGKMCNIQAFCYIPRGIKIGDNVFIGPRVTFLNDKYPPSKGKWKDFPATTVGDSTSIGGGSVILPHVKIGKNCTIGAGSVVTRDISDGAIVWGNPAQEHNRRVKKCYCPQQ